MDDSKITDGGVPPESELAEISRYARSSLKREEIYAFTATLCDNEIDRDGERFTVETLEQLAALYPGKPGLFDHSMKGRDQTARTYRAWVERDETKLNSLNEPYTALRARASKRRSALAVRLPQRPALSAEQTATQSPARICRGAFMMASSATPCSAEQKTHTNGHLWQSPLSQKRA